MFYQSFFLHSYQSFCFVKVCDFFSTAILFHGSSIYFTKMDGKLVFIEMLLICTGDRIIKDELKELAEKDKPSVLRTPATQLQAIQFRDFDEEFSMRYVYTVKHSLCLVLLLICNLVKFLFHISVKFLLHICYCVIESILMERQTHFLSSRSPILCSNMLMSRANTSCET